jgi:hypothetical protein
VTHSALLLLLTLGALGAAPEAGVCAPAESAAAACGDGADAVSADVRDKVTALLGAIDRPVRPSDWRAIGAAAEPVLAEVAASNDFPSRRARALEGLASLGGARAEALHRSLAADTTAPRAVRRSALRGLGRLLPAAETARALQPLLAADPDGAIRAGAADVLASRAPGQSCGAIRAQAAREGAQRAPLFARALAACSR